MSEVRIAAEPRTEFGKGPSRRIRRANKVPAVLYGLRDAPRHFTLPGHELMLALKHDANALLTLQTDDGDQLALPKVIVRDPIKGHLEHVDLVAVRKGEKVTVEIPIQLVGEAAADERLALAPPPLDDGAAQHLVGGLFPGLEVDGQPRCRLHATYSRQQTSRCQVGGPDSAFPHQPDFQNTPLREPSALPGLHHQRSPEM